MKKQLIFEKDKPKIISLKHYYSYIKVSKMVVSGIDSASEILKKDMLIHFDYFKNGEIVEKEDLFLGSIVKSELPILDEIFDIPYKTHSSFGDKAEDEEQYKYFDEIYLTFKYNDNTSEISYKDYKNENNDKIKVYMYYEASVGVKIN